MAAKEKLPVIKKEQMQKSRERTVYKQDSLIQKSRIHLSLREQKCILYAISKINPNDTEFGTYTFELKEFYALCGLKDESYTDLKAILKGLTDKSWWGEVPGKPGAERVYRWFSDVEIDKRPGTVEIEFHKHMMPFLLQVAGKEEFYTSYSLQYVLPMKCQYAPRLYELLKSYQKNNIRWYFEIDELKKRLNCEKYKRFPDFRRRVLEPSVEEINRYTDIKVAYRTELTGRKTTHVVFGMLRKTQKELTETKKFIVEELDGELDLLSLIEESNNDPLNQFFAEHAKKVRAEREETGKEENGCGEE